MEEKNEEKGNKNKPRNSRAAKKKIFKLKEHCKN